MAADQDWADLARASRDALACLGYGIAPRCLPGEAEPCGGSFAGHTAAHLAAIKAVADHHLSHLGAPEHLLADVYARTAAELEHAGDNLDAADEPFYGPVVNPRPDAHGWQPGDDEYDPDRDEPW